MKTVTIMLAGSLSTLPQHVALKNELTWNRC